VRRSFEAALEKLRTAGVTIHDVTIDGTGDIMTAYVNTVLPEGAEWHGRYLDTQPDDYSPIVRDRFKSGRAISGVDYLAARRMCGRLREAVNAALGSADALVLPTLPIVAPPLGASDIVMDDQSTLPVRTAMLRNTQLFNMTGHPAISLPLAAIGPQALPVGLQLVGRRDATGRLLANAAACAGLIA